MFNKYLAISLSVFFVLMIFTSIIKNKTRNLEKKINNASEKILFLKKELKDAQTEYVFLSSPDQLQKYLIILNLKDYLSYDIPRIFSSSEEFVLSNKKETKLLNKK